MTTTTETSKPINQLQIGDVTAAGNTVTAISNPVKLSKGRTAWMVRFSHGGFCPTGSDDVRTIKLA